MTSNGGLAHTHQVLAALQMLFDVVAERLALIISRESNKLSDDSRCCKQGINNSNVLTKVAFLNRLTK